MASILNWQRHCKSLDSSCLLAACSIVASTVPPFFLLFSSLFQCHFIDHWPATFLSNPLFFINLLISSTTTSANRDKNMLGPRPPIPQWLGILLGEKFFVPCIIHESSKKNEKNIFCLNCCITICPHCLPLHRPHRRLQVRRYVYQDVIRLSDAQKLINCSLVQPYTTNSAKVVFLNERPMSRPFRGSGNFCIQCDRSLQDPFLFCSISCKVNCIETAKPGGKKLDPSIELLPFFYKSRADVSFLELEEDPETTPCNGGNAMNCKPLSLVCATNELVKKKKNKAKKRSCILMPQTESISRRKGVPHRSPLN